MLSRLALEQERILNPLLDRVRTADHHQLRSLTGLIRNLSCNARNKDEMCESGIPQPGLARTPPSRLSPGLGLYSGRLEPGGQTGTPTPWGLGVGLTLTSWLPAATKVVSHLIEKLPGSVGEKAPPADVLVNIIAVLNNLVVASPIAARDLLYFDGLRKLVFIKKKRDRWGPRLLHGCLTPDPDPSPAPPHLAFCLYLSPAEPCPRLTAPTVRSPPGRPPASWPTCGSTASCTATSGR